MVAAVSGAPSPIDTPNPKITPLQDEHSKRPPFLRSEKDYCNVASNNQKRPKSRIVSSRYMSPSTSTSTSNSTSNSNGSSVSSSFSSSRRCPSPLVSRSATPLSSTISSGPKRSVSADRRRTAARPLTPADLDFKSGNSTDVSSATKLLITSTRRLSVSFQGEAYSLPVSKTKVTPPSPNLSSTRKGTPEKRRTSTPLRGKSDRSVDQTENTKHIDQHRWPTRTRLTNPLSRSLNCSNSEEMGKVIGSSNTIRALQQSMIDERRSSIDTRSSLDLGSYELLKRVERNRDRISLSNELFVPSDIVASDSESVSSGSTSGVQESGGGAHGQKGSRGIAVLAKFWQETNTRLRRLHDPGSPLSNNSHPKLIATSKSKRFSNASDGQLYSPVRGSIRPASPNKIMTHVGSSPSRGYSPSRIRNAVSTINNNFTETPSVLSFAVDVRRGKVGENRIVDAHLLRLVYNQHLQWRFVNARTGVVLQVQKRSAEKNLWNAWITISDLRDTVTKKRHRLQLLRQKLRLASILKGQTPLLEDWASLDHDHSFSLIGAIEALKASTLRLPVSGGTTADVQSLKDAIGSAVDVMQAMTSSISSFLPTVDEVNSLATELTKLAAKERALLEQCKYYVNLLAAMQVKDSSLRSHIIQHNRISTA